MKLAFFLRPYCGTVLFSLILITFLFSGCQGVHFIPLHEGESIELQFDGPVSLSYVLKGGNPQEIEVNDEQELVLVNLYDDGDPNTLADAEGFYTYFRLDTDGGTLHLGPDPETKKLIGDELQFPQAFIDAYLATAEFEFIGRGEGLLDNYEPIQMTGEFVGAKAYRHEYSCVDSMGNTVFIFDVHVPKLCGSGNHVEISEELKEYTYTREEIAQLTADNQRNLLVTQAEGDPALRPPLVIKIVNISEDPDQGSEIDDGNDLGGDPNLSGTGREGGCSLQAHSTSPTSGFVWGIFLALVSLVMIRNWTVSKARRSPVPTALPPRQG